MLPINHLLAFILLTTTPGTPDPARLAGLYPALRLPLQAMAVRWEILDPREARFILARPEDFAADLALLRHRFQDLADAPLLADSQRFPDRATVNDLLAFNRAYRQHVDMRQPVELVHWWELRTALQETDYLYEVWDKVRDARCDYYYVTVRRLALKQLRDLVGEDAYYAGTLPPCVPIWRQQQLD
jgi:hypothetical protein